MKVLMYMILGLGIRGAYQVLQNQLFKISLENLVHKLKGCVCVCPC